MGKFGKKISEKLWAMSTGKQTTIVLIACLLAAAASAALYTELTR